MSEMVPSHVCSTDFAPALGASLPEVGCRRRRGMNDPRGRRRFRHNRISCRRHLLLRNMYLRARQDLKRERKRNREAKHETRKLQRALRRLDEMPLLSGSSATLRCECCFERQLKMMNKTEKACLARPYAGCLGVRRVRDRPSAQQGLQRQRAPRAPRS